MNIRSAGQSVRIYLIISSVVATAAAAAGSEYGMMLAGMHFLYEVTTHARN